MKKKILLVDDNITNLSVGKNALQDIYQVFTVPSGEKTLLILEKITPDLILMDVEMPGMDGRETIKRIKADSTLAHIPVIFLTGKSDASSELEGLSLGAVDYIAKPFSVPLLKKRIELHLLLVEQQRQLQEYNDNLLQMVEEKTKRILKLQDAVISAVLELEEFRHSSSVSRVERTQRYLKLLIDKMRERGIYESVSNSWNTRLLIKSAQLHDVGKVGISESILNKPGRLTDEEFEDMKRHAELGREAIGRLYDNADESEFLKQAAIMAYSHHERWDGSGYPLGLSGEEIPLQGRLMAIADVYDALVSERPYKKAFTHEKAAQTIMEGKGSQFDPVLVEIFAEVADEFNLISRGEI